jgi:hypothetical protein
VRFKILVKAWEASEAEAVPMEEQLARMGMYKGMGAGAGS